VTEANGDTGDTVVLAGGTYTSVALALNASMSLVAAPGADPVLYGEGRQTNNVIDVNAGLATISGLTVTNGDTGIVGNGSGLTVTASTIEGNGEGISTSSPATVTESTISGSAGTGIELLASMTMTNSTVTGNDNRGVDVEGGTLTATGSTISDNAGFGISPGAVGSMTPGIIADHRQLPCELRQRLQQYHRCGVQRGIR
jgi:hypothetical protein